MYQLTFDDWQHQSTPHASCSPNLRLVLLEVQRRWPWFTNLGCYGVRPVRGGTAPSSHTYGAAIDIGYPARDDDLVEREVAPWLVARSMELHVDAVHDYRRCRIWRAGRTPNTDEACTRWWKAQRPSAATGMGQAWNNHLHLEVTRDGWGDETPVGDRWVE